METIDKDKAVAVVQRHLDQIRADKDLQQMTCYGFITLTLTFIKKELELLATMEAKK